MPSPVEPARLRPAMRAARLGLPALLGAVIGCAALVQPAQAQADPASATLSPIELRPGELQGDGSHWQARLRLETGAPGQEGLRVGSWRLLGDVYFAPGLAGLRATGGWIGLGGQPGIGRPAPTLAPLSLDGANAFFRPSALAPTPWRADDAATRAAGGGNATYLGLGYTYARPGSSWGLKADLGLMAARDGGPGLRRGPLMLDEFSAAGLRWSPLLQVGVSLDF